MKEILCHTPELPFEAGACSHLSYLCAPREELEAVRRVLDEAYYLGGFGLADEERIMRFADRITRALAQPAE